MNAVGGRDLVASVEGEAANSHCSNYFCPKREIRRLRRRLFWAPTWAVDTGKAQNVITSTPYPVLGLSRRPGRHESGLEHI